MPAALASGVFVGEHGSWNRKPLSGYKVVFVPFSGSQPKGLPIDALTGFLALKATLMGDLWAWRWIRVVRCWWPTTWAMWCGGSAVRRRRWCPVLRCLSNPS